MNFRFTKWKVISSLIIPLVLLFIAFLFYFGGGKEICVDAIPESNGCFIYSYEHFIRDEGTWIVFIALILVAYIIFSLFQKRSENEF